MARDEGIFEVTNVDLQLYVVHFGNIHQWQPQVADGKKKSKRQRETGTTKHLYSCLCLCPEVVNLLNYIQTSRLSE